MVRYIFLIMKILIKFFLGDSKPLLGVVGVLYFLGELCFMDAQIRWLAVVEIAQFLLTLDCSDLQFSLRLSDVHGKFKCVGVIF